MVFRKKSSKKVSPALSQTWSESKVSEVIDVAKTSLSRSEGYTKKVNRVDDKPGEN